MSIRNSLVIDCSKDVRLTKQSEKDQCDINKILGRFQKTGLCDHMSKYSPKYGNYTDIPDFQTAQNLIIQAHDEFDALPAETRALFNNDPAQLIDFVSAPQNRLKAIELGLLPDESSSLKTSVKSSNEVSDSSKEGVKA